MPQLPRFKLMFTHPKTGKPGFATVRAQNHRHALDIAAVMNLEDAVVLFQLAMVNSQKEAPK